MRFTASRVVVLCIAASFVALRGRQPVFPHRPCPAAREIIDIGFGFEHRQDLRDRLKWAVSRDNTIVRLAPDLDLDFSDLPAEWFPIRFGQCVTLTSVASIDTPSLPPDASVPASADVLPEARTPHSGGPVLRYGPHRRKEPAFLEVVTDENQPTEKKPTHDHVRISGFRLYGPGFGYQKTEDVGIHVMRSVDVEISNMEIAGWGGKGIQVEDAPGSGHTSESNEPGGRIMKPDEILIHGNYIHHNQQPSHDTHAGGYGVEMASGAWAKIYQNVFDFNRHSIAAASDTGGYWAEHNLVLKGGGYHGTLFETWTHSFDVHGSKNCPEIPGVNVPIWGWLIGGTHHIWNCGDGGNQFWILGNAWQYVKANDIKFRGTPQNQSYIENNVFPRSKNDAIHPAEANVNVSDNNTYKRDTFGHYGVCDFDGDGVDDLFLATGATWWFSSYAAFPWSYLSAKPEQLDDLRLGYFDDDLRCDVLAEHNGEWVISSGGVADWKPIGRFGAPLNEVAFGRFDLRMNDHRPGVTRRTTDAFRRLPNDQWVVTPLSHPDWQPIGGSGFPMSQLRFGDFTGDGITDVLAVEEGHWAISESGRFPWRRLNATLSDPVANLFIANMDTDDNIDDILRLDYKSGNWSGGWRVTLTWWRSRNGTQPWTVWKQHDFDFPLRTPYPENLSTPEYVPQEEGYGHGYGFVGRFNAIPGGGTLAIDEMRLGHFFSESVRRAGALADWTSPFLY